MTLDMHVKKIELPFESPLFSSHACLFEVAELTEADFNSHTIIFPDEIKRSVLKRKCEYFAGRLCAQQALKKLNINHSVSKGKLGMPIWPSHIQGSISHAHPIAAAIVTNQKNYFVGLDIEKIIETEEELSSILSLVCNLDEFHQLTKICPLSNLQLATLIFSAKEAIYKCLCPIVKFFFDFSFASIIEINIENQELKILVEKNISSQIEKGAIFTVKFFIEKEYVFVFADYQHTLF
jgi:enterobactin synthetase component D